jgi:DNA-binding LytR/AlgR family response regulator
MGLFLGLLGPFGTIERGVLVRMSYWPIVIVGGGVIGIAIDLLVARRVSGFWPRLLTSSVLMTLPVTALVWEVSGHMLGPPSSQPHPVDLIFQVFVISFGVMLLRQLAWRGVWTERTALEPETPAEDSDPFRQRLSARRRAARLIAVEAEDHYLRVHTDAGDELITARFSDALVELDGLAGYQTHRSWWVAAGAIEAVRWRRGRGELRLACGLTVPVSRTHSAVLKREGWF